LKPFKDFNRLRRDDKGEEPHCQTTTYRCNRRQPPRTLWVTKTKRG
jgi:hypothetical protein